MTVTLENILTVLDPRTVDGDRGVKIRGVTHDSRKVKKGWLFVAIPGDVSDGHAFVENALEAGASAVLATRPRPETSRNIPWITVADTRKALGPVSALVYGHPSRRMTLVGITGTNGKTTLTFLLEAILKSSQSSPGVIGTISYRWPGFEHTARYTTPEASDLQQMFGEMVGAGVTHALMEVSSHGLHLGRLEGSDFDLGVFTNLTQDHLDYHGDLEAYYKAKRILFGRLLPASYKPNPLAVVNRDDPYGRRLISEISSIPVVAFGMSPDCTVFPLEESLTAQGILATVRTPSGPVPIRSDLTGPFNLSNILAAIAVADSLGIPSKAISQGIESVRVIPGRLERVASDRGTIFVDYAHTPNALKNVLEALGMIRTGRIITVMGCGGDRDKTKRPLMGMEAAAGSDFVVITSDNPRTEDPMEIIRQVEQGVRDHGFAPHPPALNGQPVRSRFYRVVPDRRKAIGWAIRHMQDNDILLVAGKGHETYQEISGIRHQFDDRLVVREELVKHITASGV